MEAPGSATPARRRRAASGFVAGVGYDVRVGGNISLTPVANFYFGSDGDMTENGTKVISSLKHNVFDIGLGITFH